MSLRGPQPYSVLSLAIRGRDQALPQTVLPPSQRDEAPGTLGSGCLQSNWPARTPTKRSHFVAAARSRPAQRLRIHSQSISAQCLMNMPPSAQTFRQQHLGQRRSGKMTSARLEPHRAGSDRCSRDAQNQRPRELRGRRPAPRRRPIRRRSLGSQTETRCRLMECGQRLEVWSTMPSATGISRTVPRSGICL